MMSLLGMEADTGGPARDSIFYKFKIFSDKIRNNRRKVYSRRRKRTSKPMCSTVVGKGSLRRPIPFSDRCPAVGSGVSGSVVWGSVCRRLWACPVIGDPGVLSYMSVRRSVRSGAGFVVAGRTGVRFLLFFSSNILCIFVSKNRLCRREPGCARYSLFFFDEYVYICTN